MEHDASADGPFRLETFLPYRLNRLAHGLSRALQEVYRREYALTVPEWRVLVTVGEFAPITATAVGRHASLHKTKVSRAVAALEGRRWMVRRVNDVDRREAFLALAPEGGRVYRQLTGLARAFEADLLAALSGEERTAVEAALRILERRLGLSGQ